MSVVEVRDLRVELVGSGADVVDSVSFSIDAGEVLGLVGESGSGKTTIGVALLGHARRGAVISKGAVLIDGTDVLKLTAPQLRAARGKLVAYVPQDPSASLSPALRIGRQLGEMIDVHAPEMPKEHKRDRIRSVLAEVKLPTDDDFLRRFPHQLSGGQQQRVALAMAFILQPKVIVLDEPTTGLDVTTQAHVLATARDLCRAHGVAALYVTHDLAVVANLVHRVLVAYAGRTVELAGREEFFARPAHPYARGLLATIPDISERRKLEPIPGQAPAPGHRPSGCFFRPRCPHAIEVCEVDPPIVDVGGGHIARCVRASELVTKPPQPISAARARPQNDSSEILVVRDLDVAYGRQQVLFSVSASLKSRECLALVGESGSGKTTLARTIIGLAAPQGGKILYKDQELGPRARQRPAEVRQRLQYIFQSSYTSLNPRRSVGESVGLPLRHFFDMSGRQALKRAESALESVSLPSRYAQRYPDQLSGGERQRVAIARALVCDPDVLICDEITSALDVSVQASILRLLARLQEEHDLALLFVTHNLALVKTIADRVIVMNEGRIVEEGDTERVLDNPREGYTQSLLANTPSLRLATDQRVAPDRARAMPT